jgi:uncharacterized protein (DUF111 family)
MMETLRLDLNDDATRQHIRAQLFSLLDGQVQSQIESAVASLSASSGHCHDYPEVVQAIDSLQLDDTVKDDAVEIYRILNTAEAQVHGCNPDETHFHEVGNHEAIANVLAVCLAVRAIAPARIVATAVQTGKGKVQCAHGLLDIPAPATACILRNPDYAIPLAADLREGEWCTPTSAAIIAHYVDEFVE